MPSPAIGGFMFRSFTFGIVLVLSAATVALAQTAEEQAACQDDAFRVCSDAIPDRDRVFNCLVANKNAISAACRTVLTRYLQPDPPPQKASVRRARKGQGPINLNPAAAR